ncbi:alpha/beta hydrolase [Streptomyces sp. NPDC047028]|uniref:alpha/beta hydrolase n=1 Tax=Streptomyces sp. NPDC047028 TaxID=3155793 RepID=UPI0033C17C8B
MSAQRTSRLRTATVTAAASLLVALSAQTASATPHAAPHGRWHEKVVTVPASPAPGPKSTKELHVLEVGPADAGRVLVLIPGRGEAAGGLRQDAEHLSRTVPGLQVWVIDRREQGLADLGGFKGDAASATDYYLSGRYRAQTSATASYEADWGLATELNDVRRVVKRASDDGRRKVILGGHSLGATAVLDYAAWDFDGTPGYRDLSGLMVIDGGVRNALSGAGIDFSLTKDQEDTWRQQITDGAVFDNATSVYTGFGDSPEGAALWYQLAAKWALQDPHGPSVLADKVPAAHRPDRPVTNAGLLGWMVDQHAPLPGYSVHSGHLDDQGDWVDDGKTPLASVARAFADPQLAAWEWYSPNRLALDYFAGAAFTDDAVARAQGLRLFHTKDIDIPLYVFQSDLTHGTAGQAARDLASDTRIPRVDVTTDESMTHLDILFATPQKNTFLTSATRFLGTINP